MTAILKLLTLPIVIMNALSGIIALVWLLILWDWKPLLMAGFMLALSTLGANVLLFPGMLLSMGIGAIAGGSTVGALLASALANLWVVAVESAWCAGTLFIFRQFATQANYIPVLLLSYNVATGVWTYMANRDGGPASLIGAVTVQLACILAIGLIVFLWTPLETVALAFGAVMAVGYVCSLALGVALYREQRQWRA